MPELPEVESLRRSLEGSLVGRFVRGVRVHEARLRQRVDGTRLRRQLVGRRVDGLGRRSKYLLIHFESAPTLAVHLGMSGRLLLVSRLEQLASHTHVRLELDHDDELRFRDPRRFGMLFLFDPERLQRHPRFRHLGVEPLEDSFLVEYLVQRARGVRKPVKNFLMDAAVVVGVGNIYASEALHRARIHPATPAGRLRPERWRRLHDAVRKTLRQALGDGGTTLNDFADSAGRPGGFQLRLRVYGRAGETCRRCGRSVRRLVQAGRSTFYCPGCQRY